MNYYFLILHDISNGKGYLYNLELETYSEKEWLYLNEELLYKL